MCYSLSLTQKQPHPTNHFFSDYHSATCIIINISCGRNPFIFPVTQICCHQQRPRCSPTQFNRRTGQVYFWLMHSMETPVHELNGMKEKLMRTFSTAIINFLKKQKMPHKHFPHLLTVRVPYCILFICNILFNFCSMSSLVEKLLLMILSQYLHDNEPIFLSW